MKEVWFKFIFIFFPIFLWCNSLQDRICNYSSSPSNKFAGSFIQTGILLNSNINFTSYALYTQYWISGNLAVIGSIAPYIGKNDLYHYQFTGLNYHFIDEENKSFPFDFNTGIHQIKKKSTGNDKWFHIGINFNYSLLKNNFVILLKNYFTKTESLKIIGVQYSNHIFNKLNLIYGIDYFIKKSDLSINLNIELPI